MSEGRGEGGGHCWRAVGRAEVRGARGLGGGGLCLVEMS